MKQAKTAWRWTPGQAGCDAVKWVHMLLQWVGPHAAVMPANAGIHVRLTAESVKRIAAITAMDTRSSRV